MVFMAGYQCRFHPLTRAAENHPETDMTKQLEPFNLERAMAGEKVVHVNGFDLGKGRIFHYAAYGEVVTSFTDDNGHLKAEVFEENDFRMAPKIRTVMVRLYKCNGGSKVMALTDDKCELDRPYPEGYSHRYWLGEPFPIEVPI